mmetsp:Transcript_5480/g.11640  ORF Transcript_5480/g.11640 Transcript_5480/m.11640 type:complete len:244 (+) Transcript_5480:172-903(+)
MSLQHASRNENAVKKASGVSTTRESKILVLYRLFRLQNFAILPPLLGLVATTGTSSFTIRWFRIFALITRLTKRVQIFTIVFVVNGKGRVVVRAATALAPRGEIGWRPTAATMREGIVRDVISIRRKSAHGIIALLIDTRGQIARVGTMPPTRGGMFEVDIFDIKIVQILQHLGTIRGNFSFRQAVHVPIKHSRHDSHNAQDKQNGHKDPTTIASIIVLLELWCRSGSRCCRGWTGRQGGAGR